MDGQKYKDLVFEMTPRYTEWGDWIFSPQIGFGGEMDMPGARYSAGYQVFQKPIHWLEKYSHFHREEEYLVMINADLFHPEEFDAEIEIWLGYDLYNMEKHIITKPTIIRIPGSMWHCPMDFKRIDKPIMFQAVYLGATCGRVSRMFDEEGNEKFVYSGPELRHGCKLDPLKEKCTACGKCFRLENEGK